ncbi:MAG: HAD-IIB family hydrolase [Candidatus Ancillula sp.]|jgi:HAD superfamily hydrolase (TIGR01484 family)|nr:HAD-IIB family hydrolase [Candidatus Ancillula sp.]
MTSEFFIFDLDGTLASSKNAMSEDMTSLLTQLLEKRRVAVISGGKYELLKFQVVDELEKVDANLSNLHILPVSGTQYHIYNKKKSTDRVYDHKVLYKNEFTASQKLQAISALLEVAAELNFLCEVSSGNRIEDRGGQITFSALGQNASISQKEQWDPTGSKRHELAMRVQRLLPALEVRPGGSTSVDITQIGVNKAYGIRKLCAITGTSLDQLFYTGDKFNDEGNDYPVIELGIDYLEVNSLDDTKAFLEELLQQLGENEAI